ncbi:hypothetical protein OPFLODJI_01361 [Aeromonas hydrophila]|uniref:hypothetical protein n=1 Tax=Aeromonas hydrophila TaxID=644 RepID=UPI003671750B
MHHTNTAIVCFPCDGGVKQFSDALFSVCKKTYDGIRYVQCENGRWRRLKSMMQVLSEKHVIFTCNHIYIYFFLLLYTGRVTLILHDHKVRAGSSLHERLIIKLFLLFKWRFSKVIIHQSMDKEAQNLLTASNIVFIKMPAHGIDFDFTKNDLIEEIKHKYSVLYPSFSNWQASKKVKLLCFGRIEEYKNFAWFSKIVSRSHSCELLIAGSGEPSDEIRLNVGLANNQSLINMYIPDEFAGVLFQSCNYLVLPYKDITQTGLIEVAGYFSKPVILSDIKPFALPEYEDFAFHVKINDDAINNDQLADLPLPFTKKYEQMCLESHRYYISSLDSWSSYVSSIMS